MSTLNTRDHEAVREIQKALGVKADGYANRADGSESATFRALKQLSEERRQELINDATHHKLTSSSMRAGRAAMKAAPLPPVTRAIQVTPEVTAVVPAVAAAAAAPTDAVFHAHKAEAIIHTIGNTPGEECAKGVRHILDAAGIHVRRDDGDTLRRACDYKEALPKKGFACVETGNGASFDVNQVRKNTEAALGDSKRPIVVVMFDKSDPKDPGHVFYVNHDNKTFSDFAQANSGTGLRSPGDYTFQAFAYTGPVEGYCKQEPVHKAHASAGHHQHHHAHHRHGLDA